MPACFQRVLLRAAEDFLFKGLQCTGKLTRRSPSSSGDGRTSGLGTCPGMAKFDSYGYSTLKEVLDYSLLLAGSGEVIQTSPQSWGMPTYEI